MSPLVAGSIVTLLAVQQMNRLGYKQVVFLGDCVELLKILDQMVIARSGKEANIMTQHL